jgi:hypothetical protein
MMNYYQKKMLRKKVEIEEEESNDSESDTEN